jgi:ATP-dependent Clp protease ATP-binding subunit ClpA
MKIHKATKRLISYAIYDAAQRGQSVLNADHLLLGLFREDFPLIDSVTDQFQVNSFMVLDKVLRTNPEIPEIIDEAQVELGPESREVLALSELEAKRFGHNFLRVEHVLLGILNFKKHLFTEFLLEKEFCLEKVRRIISILRFGGTIPQSDETYELDESTWLELDFINDVRFRNEILDVALLRLFKHYR